MIAELRIEAGIRKGVTYLKNVYHTTPFKVANITEDKSAYTLQLMWMSSSPGILDGDEYKIDVTIAAHASLHLKTQSYQRLFNMKKGALQTMVVDIQEGASFIYLPHPTVPHEASSFTSKSKIYLAKNCTLLWGEVLTCGRKLSGEEFKFSKYHSLTEVFLVKRLVVKENLLIQPSLIDVNEIGQLEGYTHQASFIYINEKTNVSVAVTKLHEALALIKGISFGVSALHINGLVVRIVGYKAEQLYGILQHIATLLQHNETVAPPIKYTTKEVHHAG
jgi:urease accessory protein